MNEANKQSFIVLNQLKLKNVVSVAPIVRGSNTYSTAH